MKKLLLLLFCAASVMANAQIKLYEFPFDNSRVATVGTGTFSTNAGVTFTADRFGNSNGAINLANNGTTATLTGLPYGSTARSVSLWVKLNVFKPDFNFLYAYGTSSNPEGAFLKLNEARHFSPNHTVTTTHNTTGVWVHYAFTYDGTASRIYVNGALIGTSNVSKNTANNNNIFSLGLTESGIGTYFDGAIDDLQIYSGALSAQQVSTLFSPCGGSSVVNTTPSSNLTICPGNSTTLSVTGNNIFWYDTIGGNQLGSGSTFTTPVLNQSTTFYVKGDTGLCLNYTPISISVGITNLSTGLHNFWSGNAKDNYRDVVRRIVLLSSSSIPDNTKHTTDRFGNPNQALRIDSSHLGRFVLAPSGYAPAQANMSASFWFKFDSLPANGRGRTGVLGTSNFLPVIQLDSSGNMLFNHLGLNQNVSHVEKLQPNRWYHIAYARAASNQQSTFYVDGASVFSSLGSSTADAFSLLGVMANSVPTAAFPLQAGLSFDEIRIYTRTITSLDAAQLAGFPNFLSASFPAKETCSGDSLPLTVAFSGSGLDYQWVLNGNNVGTNTNAYTVPSLVLPDTTVSVIVTTGCTNHSFPIPVKTGLSAPTITATPNIINPNGNQILACAGDSILLTPAGSGNLRWTSIGNVAPAQPTFGPIYAKPNGIPAGTQTGTLSFTVRAEGTGCNSAGTNAFVVWLDFTDFELDFDSANSVLTANNSSYLKSIKWYKDGVAIDSSEAPSIIGQISTATHGIGTYTCEVVTFNDCAFTSSPFSNTPSSIMDVKLPLVSVYPNPSSDILNIESDEELETITITDVIGRVVFTQSKISNQKSKMDVSELSEATYFIRIKTINGKTAIKTFVKQ